MNPQHEGYTTWLKANDARLAALEGEVEALKNPSSGTLGALRGHNLIQGALIEELEAKLAALTQERDEFREVAERLSGKVFGNAQEVAALSAERDEARKCFHASQTINHGLLAALAACKKEAERIGIDCGNPDLANIESIVDVALSSPPDPDFKRQKLEDIIQALIANTKGVGSMHTNWDTVESMRAFLAGTTQGQRGDPDTLDGWIERGLERLERQSPPEGEGDWTEKGKEYVRKLGGKLEYCASNDPDFYVEPRWGLFEVSDLASSMLRYSVRPGIVAAILGDHVANYGLGDVPRKEYPDREGDLRASLYLEMVSGLKAFSTRYKGHMEAHTLLDLIQRAEQAMEGGK